MSFMLGKTCARSQFSAAAWTTHLRSRTVMHGKQDNKVSKSSVRGFPIARIAFSVLFSAHISTQGLHNSRTGALICTLTWWAPEFFQPSTCVIDASAAGRNETTVADAGSVRHMAYAASIGGRFSTAARLITLRREVHGSASNFGGKHNQETYVFRSQAVNLCFTRCRLISLFRGSCLAKLSLEAGAFSAVRSKAGALGRELTASF